MGLAASPTSVWIDVGPICVMKGMKSVALTMKPSSEFYDKDDWVDRNGNRRMLTAYTSLPDNFEKKCEQDTGLTIVEYDTHYTLQFRISVIDAHHIKKAMTLLRMWVDKHFDEYRPDEKATKA